MRKALTAAAAIGLICIGIGGCEKKREETPPPPADAGADRLQEKLADVERYKVEHTAANTNREQLIQDLAAFEKDFNDIAAKAKSDRIAERARCAALSMNQTIESLRNEGIRADELALEAQDNWKRAMAP